MFSVINDDDGERMVTACPECDSYDIYTRRDGRGGSIKYRTGDPTARHVCGRCSARFDEPVERPPRNGGPGKTVDRETCQRLQAGRERGYTVPEMIDALGLDVTSQTANKHAAGRCGCGEDNPTARLRGVTRILADPSVTTIEEAREKAAELREGSA